MDAGTANALLLFSLLLWAPDYVNGWTRALHSVAVARHTNCSAIAFLQKTHKVTPRFLESAKLAKEQVEQCGGYHRVLMIMPHTNDTNATTAAESGLATLKATLGVNGVIGVGPEDISIVFGLEVDRIRAQRDFQWKHGDAPELVWFDLFSRDLPAGITHVWAAEYDVAWTGNLPYVLSAFPPEPDFVCSSDFKRGGLSAAKNWVHFRNHNWLQDDEVRQCFMMLARYSIRLLRTFRGETRMGHYQFAEITGPSICHRHRHWCSVLHFNRHHDVVGKAPNGTALYSFGVKISTDVWEEILARAPPAPQGHIYHALKW